MATLIDSAEYSSNEIYEIQQTDPVEGAAVGASFNGIGVSNEPHQQLANRTAFLYGRQNTNIANISSLQNQVNGHQAWINDQNSVINGTQGYITFPIDWGTGLIVVMNWGFISFAGIDSATVKNGTFSQGFSYGAYPHYCSMVSAWLISNFANDSEGALVSAAISVEPVSGSPGPAGQIFSTTGASFYMDWNGVGTVNVANGLGGAGNGSLGLTGIGWCAFGF